MIKTVHVDDNEKSLEAFRALALTFENIELLQQFSDAELARDYLVNHDVDLAILDIEMPKKDGLWLASQIKETRALIVFLTSHADYAAKAFEACAIHYLVKPVTYDALHEIIHRYKQIISRAEKANTGQVVQISELLNNYLGEKTYPKRIFVNNHGHTTIINTEEIVYIEAVGSYSTIKLSNGSKVTASKNVKVFSEALNIHPDFIRPHRSFIINKKYVTGISRDKINIALAMKNGDQVPVSPKLREEIYDLLK